MVADIVGSSRILDHLNASPPQFCFLVVPRIHRVISCSGATPIVLLRIKTEKSGCNLQVSVRKTLVCVSWQ